LYLLTHPIWYGETPRSALETLEGFIDRRAWTLRRQVAENCRPYRLGDWWTGQPALRDAGEESKK
jgi:hypothetical protein